MLSTIEDVTTAFASEARLEEWSVKARGLGTIEIQGRVHSVTLLWPERWHDRALLGPILMRARGGHPLIVCGTEAELVDGNVDTLRGAPLVAVAALPMSVHKLSFLIRMQLEAAARHNEMLQRDVLLARARYENDLLVSIGRALTKERDISSLLAHILRRAREVTNADAGSVYIIEGDDPDLARCTLRFETSQNDSVKVSSRGFTLPVSPASIVGTCVLARHNINIPDLYALDAPGEGNNPWGFVHDRSFDERHDYQTRSMLTVPMIDATERVIGVIQLINKRARGVIALRSERDFHEGVIAFDEEMVELAEVLASQAGIALENAMLYDEVRTLFEGFVRASVTAIESRDPTTSGHSQRVADLTVGLAKAAEREELGPYADLEFTVDEIKEIEYAALLHDFGKVGVREHVLVKAKKLYPHERDLIVSRFHLIRKTIEAEQLASKVRYLLEASRDQVAAELDQVDRAAADRLAELDDYLQFILQANEPSVLEKGGFERIAQIAARTFAGPEGGDTPYLHKEEIEALQIGRGSLTLHERHQIESHVVHTYNFLKQIPWGRTFKSVPEIAGSHHEKLDGSGYPHGVPALDIPVQGKIMTISDIYDALTASDRPYKRAVPETRALSILEYEVNAGKLDAELFRLFVDAEVYRIVGGGRP